ncbi:hypothetical protein [Pseudooceanicola sp. HF7]|uniref:hypothetical protein n=1 Tax=Pseudooceanicola sp. HF7 TaxID=2721560 RepID=UPI001430C591|nr:hypothetical protein [Pseudooceanicola sp. HF7]NIZ10154.1 hypothetical protein [Pseudooceanicola sp. HF7]
MDDGRSWRIHAWKRAQAQHQSARLPVEIVRLRMARAKELGLSYRDYAAIRASSGRDVSAYLISSNAMQVYSNAAPPPDHVAARLARLRHVRRIGLAMPPLVPEALMDCVENLDAAFAAPPLLASFPRMRDALSQAQGRLPAAGLVAVIGHALEGEWAAAGRLGGVLTSDRLFG